MSDRPDITPEDDAAAAEYVLGLLPEAEARAFRARIALEPALRTAVLGWERRFAAMAEREVEPVAPPAGVEAQIMARLTRHAPRPWWQRLSLWRGGLALLGAALIALAVLVYTDGPGREGQPDLTARIAAEDDSLVLTAALDLDEGTLLLSREAGQVAVGRVQELWLIAGEAAPVSLGLLADSGDTRVTVPEALRPLFAGAILAVSDEPPGGSPTGAPTGDVLAIGPVTES